MNDEDQAMPEDADSIDTWEPVRWGVLAGVIVGGGAGLVANYRNQQISDQAQELYDENCSKQSATELCSSGVELAKRIMMPHWASSPVVTGVVFGSIAFLIVTIAVWSHLDLSSKA